MLDVTKRGILVEGEPQLALWKLWYQANKLHGMQTNMMYCCIAWCSSQRFTDEFDLAVKINVLEKNW